MALTHVYIILMSGQSFSLPFTFYSHPSTTFLQIFYLTHLTTPPWSRRVLAPLLALPLSPAPQTGATIPVKSRSMYS